MDQCTPFTPRAVHPTGIVRHGEWRLRRWTITYREPFEDARFAGGRSLALAALPRPATAAGRPAVGFLIEHQGNGFDYVVLGWWDRENELPLRVYVCEEGGEWRPAQGGESVCVWDLDVIWREREAYVRDVLGQQGPDLERYLTAVETQDGRPVAGGREDGSDSPPPPAPPPRPATLAVWAGEDGRGSGEATQVPVVHSVSFGFRDVEEWRAVARGDRPGHIYGRNSNPTVAAFEAKVRMLEGAEAATSASSGMGIISSTLSSLLGPGDRVVSLRHTYGGTTRIFTDFLPRFGVAVSLCDGQAAAIEAELARGCKVLFLESPTNPTLQIVDLGRLATAAHAVGAVVIVDNTLATPINQNPLALGADLVLHSATKFLGGHADALGGAVCGARHLVERIYRYREIHGAALDPMAAYLLLRGMKTLPLRVGQQNQSAMRIARFLTGHPAVARVHYPGLASHPGHSIACRQMRGFGGVLAFELKPSTLEAAGRVLPRLRYAHLAANLGAVETVAGPPATTSHVECTPEQREALGIPEGLIRYSVGIEDCDDLIADLAQALAPA